MKPDEFQIVKGIESPEFVRGVTINDRPTEIKVIASLNNKKGVFKITTNLNSGQITGNAKLDDATIKLVSELQKEAIKYALEWKRDWVENNVAEDGELDFDN